MSNQDLSMLQEMGFSTNKAMKALAITGNQGVEIAMEWLLAHGEELENLQDHPSMSTQPLPESRNNDSSTVSSAPMTQERIDPPNDCESAGDRVCVTPFGLPNEPTQAHDEAGQGQPPPNEANSQISSEDQAQLNAIKQFKCEKCGISMDQNELEKHAKETGHTSFVENVTLSEEEKKKQLIKLAEKIKQKRMERETFEREEELLREKNRIKSGKEIIAAKKRLEEAEMKKLIEARKREKHEDKVARERIKKQIEDDRKARQVRFGQVVEVQSCSATTSSSSSSATNSTNTENNSASSHPSKTRIQIRLLNGSTIQENFGSKEQLSCIRLFVDFYRTDGNTPYDLMTNFPKRVYENEDYEKPLDSLNLVPSAVLIMVKKQQLSEENAQYGN